MLHRNQSPKRVMPRINRNQLNSSEVACGLRLKNVRSGNNNTVGIVRL